MLSVEPLDFVELEQFRYFWRLGERHGDLPAEALDRIHLLSEGKAREVDEIIRVSDCSVIWESSRQIDAETRDATLVRDILNGDLLASDDIQVAMSYDRSTALVMSVGILCRYWRDFCYPGSDDIVIYPFDGSWILAYDHEECFVLRRRAAPAALGQKPSV